MLRIPMLTIFVVILLVLLFSALNIGVGLFAAAFFGIGPLKRSYWVRFLSDPVFPPRSSSR
jgi:hypothetical protein